MGRKEKKIPEWRDGGQYYNALCCKHFKEWENNNAPLKHTRAQSAVHMMNVIVANSLGVGWCVN